MIANHRPHPSASAGASDVTALAERIDALLPQTQCGRCGYVGCAPYALAIAEGHADIDRCPPGGDTGAAALAAVAGRAAKPVDRARGAPGPLLLARIDEAACIGCTLCIAACPVDAIAGAQRRMHVVLPSLCSGCELCVTACPVDCIAMHSAGRDWSQDDADAARERHRERNARVARAERIANRATTLGTAAGVAPTAAPTAVRAAAAAAALARARARRHAARS